MRAETDPGGTQASAAAGRSELSFQDVFQVFDLASLFARTSCVTSATSFAHCRSKPISYGVNIRGAGEVPSLRLSKAIEGVAEVFPPPLLEVPAVRLSEFMDRLL